jgi:glutathione S-transferase
MIEFFDYLPSQNAYKVRTLLSQMRIPHRTMIISIFEGKGHDPKYLEVSPMGAVPAIRLSDGRALAESNAILTYLADGSPYMPQDAFGRAKVHQWLSFEQDYIQNTVGSLRYWTMTGKLPRRPKEMIDGRRAVALKALAALDRELASRAFICGNAYTVADLSLYAYASRAGEAGISLEPYPHFRAWVARVEAVPGFVTEVHLYSTDPNSSGEL